MKTAPKTAQLPPVTRELIAIWETELDQFAGDIQARLQTVAALYNQNANPSFPLMDAPQRRSENSPSDVNTLEPVVELEIQTPVAQDMTNDRLLAIKQKIAARLQGEAS